MSVAALTAGVVPPAAMPAPAARLDPRTVVALDALRAVAALYVVLHHVAAARGWLGGAGIMLRFGQEAVIVFFLLSGFVIFASEHRRALRPRGYYWRRVRRIYPILLLAMGVSTLVALDDGDLTSRFDPAALVGTLAGVQDVAALKPGVTTDPYLDNFPLWSLSYELAFYLVFPFALALWSRMPRAATSLIGAACCLCYLAFALHPAHVTLVGAYFLIWWAGAMAAAARLEGRRGLGAIAAPLAWLAPLSLLALGVVAVRGVHGAGVYPVLPLRHFAAALLLLATVAGLGGHRRPRLGPTTARIATGAASISYAVYVFHYPLLVQWHRARGGEGLVAAAMVLIALSWAAERHLVGWLPQAPID